MVDTANHAGIGRDAGAFASLRVRFNNSAWIQSPLFDSLLLILAPLATLPIFVGAYFRIPVITLVGGISLAFAHYWSSASFYFWDENRDYHRTRWLAFYAGPALLAVVYLLLIGFRVPYGIQFVLFFWNTWHVARQNCGILAIYRARAGVSEPSQKPLANRAIISASVFLALWNINTHQEVSALFGFVSPQMTQMVKIGAGLVAAFFVAQLIVGLIHRKESIGLPEGVFIASSILFFYPYLFIRTSLMATFAMLLPHYVQYMALVWLLHRRKFGGAKKGAPLMLRAMSTRLYVLLPMLFTVGFAFYLMYMYSRKHGYEPWFEILYLLIAFEHFYLDGLIWSFRQPHVRQTILPFLLRRQGGASA